MIQRTVLFFVLTGLRFMVVVLENYVSAMIEQIPLREDTLDLKKEYMKLFCFVSSLIILIASCNSKKEESENEKIDRLAKEWVANQDKYNSTDEYEIIRVTFTGYPDKEEVQPMLEEVMRRYDFSINRDNILKVSNMLSVLKGKSLVGVSEMQILKHIYQKAIFDDLATQAAYSATILEQSK